MTRRTVAVWAVQGALIVTVALALNLSRVAQTIVGVCLALLVFRPWAE